MSAVSPCGCDPCVPIVTTVPGTGGDPGDAGADGRSGSSLTNLSASIVTLVKGSSYSVILSNVDWVAAGMYIFIEDAGYFSITALSGMTITAKFLNITANSAGVSILTNKKVSPAGPAVGGSLPTAFTDTTYGTAGNTALPGVGVVDIPIYVNLANVTTNTSLHLNRTLGFRAQLLSTQFIIELIGGGASKDASFIPYINNVAVAGGVVSLTTANMTSAGTAGSIGTGVSSGVRTDANTVASRSSCAGWDRS